MRGAFSVQGDTALLMIGYQVAETENYSKECLFMSTSTLVQSPMVKFLESFRNASQSLVVSGQLTKELANEMYIAVRNEKKVMDTILPLIVEEDNGSSDCYDAIYFFFDDAEYQEHIEVEHGEFWDDIQNDVIANHDKFTIHLIAKHQGEDDYMNYEFPCGEDRWHTGIVFRIHSVL